MIKWNAKELSDRSWAVIQSNDTVGVTLLGYPTREPAVAVAVELNQADEYDQQAIVAREWSRPN